MAQTLWVENEKQFSGGTDVGAKISKRKLEKKNRKKEKRNGMEKKNCYLCQTIFFSQPQPLVEFKYLSPPNGLRANIHFGVHKASATIKTHRMASSSKS